MSEKTVVELFAGVGGFRLGLDKSGWKTIYANQWEPGKAKQWAFECYDKHFTDSINTNIDVAAVDAADIPDHTLLVGGFPCQDYSVAHSLVSARGIEGKKGVLWWEIRRIAEAKRPRFILLENVDRLLKSPARQRGRDFAVILSCLNSLGYTVQWRVINAADYGLQQRRRRTFIFATTDDRFDVTEETVLETGFFAKAFPCALSGRFSEAAIPEDLVLVSESFAHPFGSAGICKGFRALTADVAAVYDGPAATLGSVLERDVDERYFVKPEMLPKWEYLKGAKREKRTARTGYEYYFSEGPIAYPDVLDKPARTMLTSEGTVNRSSHIVADPGSGRMRILTPVECERIDGFPDNWTDTGMPERMRYFCMGNALVVQLIETMGKAIAGLV